MSTMTAPPPKLTIAKCTSCGLEARPPIVVPNIARGIETWLGRCANRKACAMRVRRAINRQRQEKRNA